MTETLLREPLWRGWQAVSGLWLGAAWLSLAQRRARLLAQWRPGSRALRFDDGDLLLWPDTRWRECADLPGWPLCQIGARLSAAPLAPAELAQMADGELVLVTGAGAVARSLRAGVAIDLSAEIDLSAYVLVQPLSLQSPSAPRVAPLGGRDVRQLVGAAVPPPSAQRAEFLQALAARQRAERSATGAAGTPVAAGGWLQRLSQRLLGSGLTAAGTALPARQAPAAPSRWRDWLTRLALATRVAALLGARQGAWMRQLLQALDRGDLDEALRHALPIDGQGPSLGTAFGVPEVRADFRLSRTLGASTSMHLPDELQHTLRQRYRAAFERLDRAGDIDRAVYVLAELLNARKEALDYLVRHGRAEQAAELALGWDMPAALCIRLLMLAGDPPRAVLLARRDHAYGEAVTLLQESHPALADQLRGEWGQTLRASGDWLAAIEIIWPVPALQQQACMWLLQAEAAGADLGARALAVRARLLPDSLDDHSAAIAALCDPWADPDDRHALAADLLARHVDHPAGRALAGLLLPAISADLAAGHPKALALLPALKRLAANAALNADAPPWPVQTAVSLWSRVDALLLTPPVAGRYAIHDVIALPGRRYLCARGEAGVVLIDHRGRVRQRYDVPCDTLIASHSGAVALALIARDRRTRIERIDLVQEQTLTLQTLALESHASIFDGHSWSVVIDQQLLLLDVSRPQADALWRVGDLPGRIVQSGYHARCERHLLRTDRGWIDLSYSLPSRRRMPAVDLPATLGERGHVLTHALGPTLLVDLHQGADGIELGYQLAGREGRVDLCAPIDGVQTVGMQGLDCGLVVVLLSETAHRVIVLRLSPDAHVVARCDWPADAHLRIREQGPHLLLYDDQGRLLHIDTSCGQAQFLSLR